MTGKELDAIMREAGLDPKECQRAHELERLGLTEQFLAEQMKVAERARKSLARKMLRRPRP